MAAAADRTSNQFDAVFGARRHSRPYGDADVHENKTHLTDYEKLKAAFVDIRRAGVAARIFHTQGSRERWSPEQAYVLPNQLLGASNDRNFGLDNEQLVAPLHLTYRADADEDKWSDLDVAAIACKALRANGLACDTPADDGESIVIEPARQLSATLLDS